ncbi:sigma-70 family RNA polymerase sigma factor [Acidobacteria bacterium AH-259-G07]|nr:sigma-70 family RNA polymerase sigma factor [Acidobacteria bacterium AH-259-L09]MDA2926193.1 sigma-70 family RNA polymerase sigma factor [Acidobacteria bacterium AH-259-G07]
MREKRINGKNPQTFSISGEELDDAVSRAKKGSVQAFQKLYEHYGRKILNYIYRMTGSREEAEDLTQDTFILAYTNLSSLKENIKFQSWLFRIAQNNVYQKYRGKRPPMDSIQQEETPELSDVQKLATPQISPEDRVLSKELEQVIEQVISQLPDKYKEVFVLSAIHKLSYKEISEIVGRSLASVKSDIHRARVEVRDKIKTYLGENYGMSNLF